jgi:hypothetical protein
MCGDLVKDHTGYEGHTIVTEASEAIAEAERGKEGGTVTEAVSGASSSQRPSERVAPLPSTPSPDIAGVKERLVLAVEQVEDIAHADYAENDPTTGEAFDYQGRQLIEAAIAMTEALHVIEGLERDKAQGIAMINEMASQINEAQARCEELTAALEEIARVSDTYSNAYRIARTALTGREA